MDVLIERLIRNKCENESFLKILNFSDGIVDCADNSDESAVLCGYPVDIILSTTSRPTRPPVTSPPTASPRDEKSCLIPNDLSSAVQVYFDYDTTREVSKGSYAPEFTNIIYKCLSKYVLEGNTTNFCLDGKWTDGHPTCRRYCSPLPLSGITIKASCEYSGETISCQQPHRPMTTARITCAVGYRKPVDRTVIDVLRCDDEGEWDYHAFRCEQICGLEGFEFF